MSAFPPPGLSSVGTVTPLARSAQSKSVLECRVCDNVYGVQGDKIPRLLLCGHSLCHACLLRLPKTDKLICCPFDRQTTPLGPNGVWDLKKNFALIELLERVLANEAASVTADVSSVPSGNDAVESTICCDENEEHAAAVYCTTCGSHLCLACSESTHATRTLAKHRRIPLAEKPREKRKCPSHTMQVLEFVCLESECQGQASSSSVASSAHPAATSNSPLMCYICKDYGRHKGHKYALMETEAEKMRAVIDDAVSQLRKFMEELTDTARKLEITEQRMVFGPEGSVPVAVHGSVPTSGDSPSDVTSSQGSAAAAKERVRVYFEGLREQLKREETAALAVVDTHIRERLCAIRQQEEDISAILGQVAAVCVHSERVAKQDDAKLLAEAGEIRAMLEAVDAQHAQVEGLINSTIDASIPITFTKDNRVHIGPKIEMRVVTLGLDGSGKTSLLFKLKQDEFVSTIPTIGFNVETLDYKNVKFTVWDVGGQHKLRPLWKHYYLNTQAVIYVIDSSDHERLEEAKGELVKLLGERELKDAIMLILLSKQDVEGCMTLEEISDQLSLHKLCCGKSWHIKTCSARDGEGLTDSLDWLSLQLIASGVSDLG